MRYLRSVQMTKTNLIDHVAEATNGTKKETEQLLTRFSQASLRLWSKVRRWIFAALVAFK